MLLVGIDEAGRGPILGPLVMAAVVVEHTALPSLRALGARDSKEFGAGPDAHRARATVLEKLRSVCVSVHTAVSEPEEIDAHVVRGDYNELERKMARKLLAEADPRKQAEVTLDGKTIFRALTKERPAVNAVNHADKTFAHVAAASIAAKVLRDTLTLELLARYEPEFGRVGGMGYVCRPTLVFLRNYVAKYRRLPPETRTSWTRNLNLGLHALP